MMHGLIGLLTALSLCISSAASSENSQDGIITHKLHRRTNVGVGRLKTFSSNRSPGTSSMQLVADVLKKDTNSLPNQQTSTGILNQDGTDVSYFIDCKIGSNDQKLSLVVDTGSYYTWVYGSDCSSAACSSHRSFDMKKSSTVKSLPYTFSIQYSSGPVSGSVVNDRMSFSGFQTRIDFGIADTAGDTFSNFPIDGIMGLSAKDSSADEFPSIITTLSKQKLISKRIFGINLGRSANKHDEGSITFGGVDTTKFTGDIHYAPVQDDSILWSIDLQGLTMGDHPVTFDGTRSAIIDTGTTLLVLPPKDALQLHSYIEGAQTDGSNFAIPCSTNITLQLTLGGYNWAISPTDYMGAKNGNSDMCVSNIEGVTFQGNTTWILGDVFLRNVYSVFDVDNQQVGFAAKEPSKTNPTPDDTFKAVTTSSEAAVSTTSTSSSDDANTSTKSTSVAPSATSSTSSTEAIETKDISSSLSTSMTASTSLSSSSLPSSTPSSSTPSSSISSSSSTSTSATTSQYPEPVNSVNGRTSQNTIYSLLASALILLALLDHF